MSETQTSEPLAEARFGAEGYRVEIDSGGHALVADEPASVGGGGAGPDPFALLYASLASCVAITIRMYASRKEWPLTGGVVRIFPERKPASPVDSIEIRLTLEGDLTDEQRARIIDIAGRCPVHRTLEREVPIRTSEG